MSGARENDRRRDDTCQHGQGMLEAEKQSQEYGHLVMEAEEGRRSPLLLHEGQVRLEEECIVVCADEAIPVLSAASP